jgi:putative transposase
MQNGKDHQPLPERHYPAHHPAIERHNTPVVLFCTVCILNRRPVLGEAEAVQAVQQAWRETDQWRVGEFLFKPEHVHFFCVPGVPQPESVKLWCRYWKRLASQYYPSLKGKWQMDVWDTQMRNADQYTEKLSYMRQNPVRRSLARNWEEWPYKGVLHVIRW